MSKQIHVPEDVLDAVINRLDAVGQTELSNGLIAHKSLVVGDGKKPRIPKAASKFTLNEVIQIGDESKVATNKFTLAPSFESIIDMYTRIFDRSSEALCRTGIDLVLLESLSTLKGYTNAAPPDDTKQTGERTAKVPLVPYGNIQVYGELEFDHCVHTPTAGDIVVKGRINYGIAPLAKDEYHDKEIACRRLFESLLVVVEAKNEEEIGKALPQLLLYLGCLRQSHQQRGRKDTSVYGVQSDGLRWAFVTITHDGTVRVSRYFDIQDGETETIKRCLEFMLKNPWKHHWRIKMNRIERILMSKTSLLCGRITCGSLSEFIVYFTS